MRFGINRIHNNFILSGQKYFEGINQRPYYDSYATRRLDEYEYGSDYSENIYGQEYDRQQQPYQYYDDGTSESQHMYNLNDFFPDFDKFMSFLK